MFVNNAFQTNLPPQQIPLKEKLKDKDKFGISKWMKQNMDALEAIGRFQFQENYVLKENYDIIRGRFLHQHYVDRSDMYDLLSSLTEELNIPSYLRHYDITTKAINVLVGEFIKRPDKYRAYATDNGSKNEILRMKTELLLSYVQNKIQQEVEEKMIRMGIDPYRSEFSSQEEMEEYQIQVEEARQEMTPVEIEEYMSSDYMTEAEKFANHIMDLDNHRFSLQEKEAMEFEDMLVTDRCFRHFYITATGYSQETWHPLNTFFHRSPEIIYVEDGDYVGRVFWYSKAQIIDRYGWMMTEDQIKALYPKKSKQKGAYSDVMNEAFNVSMFPWGDYREYMTQVNAYGYDPHTGYPGIPNQMAQFSDADIDWLFGNGVGLNFRVHDIVMVTEAYWRSQARIGKLNYLNPETGEVESDIITEAFEPKLFGIEEITDIPLVDSEEPNTVCWSWVTQIWQGIKLNVNFSDTMSDESLNKFNQRALYLGVKPVPFQFRGTHNPYTVAKLPVIGGIFNNRGSNSQSLVDLIKPYQVFYNMCLNQAYELSQREIGKMILMDVNIIPALKDWGGGENFEKFLAVGKALGIGVVDTKTSGTGQTSFAATNSYQVLDATESDRIAAKINLGILIEQQAYRQLGITDQRMGQIQASETATGTQTAVSNSYSQTESYFEKFYNYKKRVLQANIEIAKFVYSKDKDITLAYNLSDTSRVFVNITDEDLLLRDIGVYAVFSQEVQRQLETMQQLAIQNNTANIPISKLAKMLTLNSTKQIIKELEAGEKAQAAQMQQAQQAEMEKEQMKIEAEAAEKEKDRQLKKYEIDTKANTELQKVTLQGIANEGSYNPNRDTTDLLIAQKDLSLKENQINQQFALKNSEMTNKQIEAIRKERAEKEKLKREEKIKADEALAKQKIEQQKLEQIIVQNKSQEKINTESVEGKLKLAETQLEIKKLEKKMKEMELDNVKSKSKIELEHLEKKIELEEDMTEVKKQALEELTDVKIKESKKISDINIEQKKKESKIKLEATKKSANKKK